MALENIAINFTISLLLKQKQTFQRYVQFNMATTHRPEKAKARNGSFRSATVRQRAAWNVLGHSADLCAV